MSTRLAPPCVRPLTRPLRSAAILYFAIMTYVVLAMLNEVRPMWYFVLAAVLFVLSQLDFFLLSKVICKVRPAFRQPPVSSANRARGSHRAQHTRLTAPSLPPCWKPPPSPCCTLRGEALRKVRRCPAPAPSRLAARSRP